MKNGIRKAFLVHSYRDERGKPRHKTLAYLGKSHEIEPELLVSLKERHRNLPIQWETIKASPHPAPTIDPTSLSDQEFLHRLKEIRHERGFSSRDMIRLLAQAGFSRMGRWPLTGRQYRVFEEGFAQDKPHTHYTLAKREMLPYLRKVLGKGISSPLGG